MLNDFKDTLISFAKLLENQNIHYALIGGLAVAYWGEERFTRDIDLTISLGTEEWPPFQKFMESSQDLIVDQIATDSSEAIPYLIRIDYLEIKIDLIISLTEFQESLLKRSVPVQLGSETIQFASPEDIIVSKLIANRRQDLADIEKILLHVKDLDFDYIKKWVKIWELESIWEEFDFC